MKKAIKHVRVELTPKMGEELYTAMLETQELTGRWVNASDIIRPAIDGFIKASSQGRGREFINQLDK